MHLQYAIVNFFFQAEDGIRDVAVTGVQTCALPISLEEILKETYGVIVYQEQVMAIANKAGGFSLGQADLMRRAMGKKKPEEMGKLRTQFIEGAKKRKITEKKSEKRSEEHTSELQSRLHLVCRLLLEKKKKTKTSATTQTNNETT